MSIVNRHFIQTTFQPIIYMHLLLTNEMGMKLELLVLVVIKINFKSET